MLYDPIRHHENETIRNLAELRDCLRDKGRWPQGWVWDFRLYYQQLFGDCGTVGCAIGMYHALKNPEKNFYSSERAIDTLFPDMDSADP